MCSGDEFAINSENLNVETCGICFDQITNNDISKHPCFKGYKRFYHDAETSQLYPVTNFQEYSSDGNDDEVLQCVDDFEIEKTVNINKRINTKNREKVSLNFDDEELLILEARAREPLWNFQLNIQERNSKITNKLWEEVSLALGNKISAEGAKQKFKSLHDTYRKIMQAENLPSGSAKKSSKKWHHYDAMNFLRDSCLIKQTTSNLCSTVIECASNTGNENNTSLNESSRKRKRQNDLSGNAFERIVDALSTNQETTIPVPPPPQVDEIDAFLILLGHRIKKLPQEKQMEAMQNHLQLSFNYLR